MGLLKPSFDERFEHSASQVRHPPTRVHVVLITASTFALSLTRNALGKGQITFTNLEEL